jgi:hypothetical protein
MMEAERRAPRLGKLLPVLGRGAQQPVGPDDVGLDEGVRAVDRAVDMALGREMGDDVRIELGHDGRQGGAVANVGLDEAVAR